MELTGNLTTGLKKINGNIDFASAVALTRTAKIVQADEKKKLADEFTLKNTWTERGIRIIPATKEKLEAIVYSKDWYLEHHETGKRRYTGKRGEFWIPGKGFKTRTGIDPRKQVIPRAYRGERLLKKFFPLESADVVSNRKKKPKQKTKPFRVRLESGAEAILLRRKVSSPVADVLYIIVKQAIHIRGRKFFSETLDASYQKHFEREFDRAWSQYILQGV